MKYIIGFIYFIICAIVARKIIKKKIPTQTPHITEFGKQQSSNKHQETWFKQKQNSMVIPQVGMIIIVSQ